MRFGYALLLAGALSLGIGAQAQAADFTAQKAGNTTIDIPSDWQVLPQAMVEQLAQSSGANILLLAQGPDQGMPKLTVIQNPDPATQEAFLKMDKAQADALCKQFNGNLEGQFGKGKVEASCSKVENKGVGALATQMTIPAQGNRPEIVNMTWSYPNGGKGVAVSAMFLKKDAKKFAADVKKSLQSLKFDK